MAGKRKKPKKYANQIRDAPKQEEKVNTVSHRIEPEQPRAESAVKHSQNTQSQSRLYFSVPEKEVTQQQEQSTEKSPASSKTTKQERYRRKQDSTLENVLEKNTDRAESTAKSSKKSSEKLEKKSSEKSSEKLEGKKQARKNFQKEKNKERYRESYEKRKSHGNVSFASKTQKKAQNSQDTPQKTSVIKNVSGQIGRTTVHRIGRTSDDEKNDDNFAVEAVEKLGEETGKLSQTTNKTILSKYKHSRPSKNKAIQKRRIKKQYAKDARNRMKGKPAQKAKDAIKDAGSKAIQFLIKDSKTYLVVLAFIGLLLLLMGTIASCSAMFTQNLMTYAASSYLSDEMEIQQADLYYTELEADLQYDIDHIEETHTGYDEYRYDLEPVGHDPFTLINYLSAQYQEFTFSQVQSELDDLFDKQYQLKLEETTETVTERTMVRVGESLGLVTTSGYCNCVLCAGSWAGGPTASGVMPTAYHTIAVDRNHPFVPIGTHVVMNGTEYVVEDTGNFSRYGVQFDVYYSNHANAQSHGHQVWEAYLADANGSQEIEVTKTVEKRILNVTLVKKDLKQICESRLQGDERELYDVYEETKGNLQIFVSPVEDSWYDRILRYYGYEVDSAGNKVMNQGIDIETSMGESVYAGLTGKVVSVGNNRTYGNYVVIKSQKGYQIRYAYLRSSKVRTGQEVVKGAEIGTAGTSVKTGETCLHIELSKDGEFINPLFYLESRE